VPTAPSWRSIVFGGSRAEVLDMILRAADHIIRRVERFRGQNVRFEFTPEVFSLTEPDYVLEVCNALTERWDASDDRPVVLNLASTVEVGTPNVYADQIEYMHRNLARRGQVILSVHPHNDRGTAVWHDEQQARTPEGESEQVCFVKARAAENVGWGAGIGATPAQADLAAVISSAVRCGAFSCGRLRSMLRLAIRRAERDGKVAQNVAALAEIPAAPRRQSRSMNLDQIRALLGLELTPWWRAYLTFALMWAAARPTARPVLGRRGLQGRRDPRMQMPQGTPRPGGQEAAARLGDFEDRAVQAHDQDAPAGRGRLARPGQGAGRHQAEARRRL